MTFTRNVFNGRYTLASSLGVITSCITSCAVTSPHWDYVPASTSAAIPVQAWTPYTSQPLIVECAQDTTAHGGPSPGESAYVVAATIPVSASANLDSEGTAMYTGASNVTFPATCWNYFGSYDFWQLNLRITQMQPNPFGGTDVKKVFSSFDLAGLSCLGSHVGSSASWYGFFEQGCEKTYLGEDEQIPYIVLRINGYANGLDAAMTAPSRNRDKTAKSPPSDSKTSSEVLSITPFTPEQADALRKQSPFNE